MHCGMTGATLHSANACEAAVLTREKLDGTLEYNLECTVAFFFLVLALQYRNHS